MCSYPAPRGASFSAGSSTGTMTGFRSSRLKQAVGSRSSPIRLGSRSWVSLFDRFDYATDPAFAPDHFAGVIVFFVCCGLAANAYGRGDEPLSADRSSSVYFLVARDGIGAIGQSGLDHRR